MSVNPGQNRPNQVGALPFVITLMLMCVAFVLVVPINGSTSLFEMITEPFALKSMHVWWYINRASGLMAYLLFWLSTVFGFAVSSKIFDAVLEHKMTIAFHEHLSLLGLGFSFLHAGVLLLELVEPFTLEQILVPFISNYRPFWVGLGILSLYFALLVSLTFYIRRFITLRVFQGIHVVSLLAYAGTLFHGLYAGTDSDLPWVLKIYALTFLTTVFFAVYWIACGTPSPKSLDDL
jgi:hypothetical protein